MGRYGPGPGEYEGLSKALNSTAYSLMINWLTNDRDKPEINELTNRITLLTQAIERLSELQQEKKDRDYDRLSERVSMLLLENEELKEMVVNWRSP